MYRCSRGDLKLADLDAEYPSGGQDLGRGVQVLEGESARYLLVGGHDAGFEDVAVEVDLDRPVGDRVVQPGHQVRFGLDVGDGQVLQQPVFGRVDVTGAD